MASSFLIVRRLLDMARFAPTGGEASVLWRILRLAWRSGLKSVRLNSEEDPSVIDFFRCTCQEDSHAMNLTSAHVLGQVQLSKKADELWTERAVIRPPVDKAADFYPAVTRLPLRLAGGTRSIEVEGIYFCQQGPDFSCAHAALETMTQHLAGRFPTSRITRAEVADIVKQQWPSLCPKEGLTSEHISHVLEQIGYQAFVYPRTAYPMDWIAYLYVESGLPALVGLLSDNPDVGHAVVCLGHSFEPDVWWVEPEEALSVDSAGAGLPVWVPASQWTNQYLINDDRYGPGLALSRAALRRADLVIGVLPPTVLVPPEIAEIVAAASLYDEKAIGWIAARATTSGDPTGELFSSHMLYQLQQNAPRLVLRPVLVDASRLLNHIATSDYGNSVKEFYEGLQLSGLYW